MKRFAKIIACVLLPILFLTSCSGPDTIQFLFATRNYKLYKTFSEVYAEGMDKQQVLLILDSPEAYSDIHGNRYRYNPRNTDEENEAYLKGALSESTDRWCYSCYKFSDPAYPYDLILYFDSEGRLADVIFKEVKGG